LKIITRVNVSVSMACPISMSLLQKYITIASFQKQLLKYTKKIKGMKTHPITARHKLLQYLHSFTYFLSSHLKSIFFATLFINNETWTLRQLRNSLSVVNFYNLCSSGTFVRQHTDTCYYIHFLKLLQWYMCRCNVWCLCLC